MAKRKREIRPDLQTEPGTVFSFVLDGNIPSKKNRVRFGANGVYHDKNFSAWHKRAVAQLAPQWKHNAWLAKTSLVEIQFEFESLRSKDISNCLESINDLFVDCYILKDDSFKIIPAIHATALYNKGTSKTAIRITT